MNRLCALVLALLCPTLALGERVVIIAPRTGPGPEATALSAELQDAVDRAFAFPGRYLRASADAVQGPELAAAFGCPRVDDDCAREAARAAEADLALLPTIERRGSAVVLQLALLAPERLRPHHQVVWVIEPVGALDDSPALGAALRAATAAFLRHDPPGGLLVSAQPEGWLTVDGARWPAHQAIPVAPGLHTVHRRGWPERRQRVAAGEVHVLSAAKAAPVADAPGSARRTSAWITAGAGLAMFVAGAFVGGQSKATQRAYDTATAGDALDRLASRGKRQAATANVLFLASGLATATAAWLFWGP